MGANKGIPAGGSCDEGVYDLLRSEDERKLRADAWRYLRKLNPARARHWWRTVRYREPGLLTGKHPFSYDMCVGCRERTLHKYFACIHCGTKLAMAPVPPAEHWSRGERIKLLDALRLAGKRVFSKRRMPWTPGNGPTRHTRKAQTPHEKQVWAKIANAQLSEHGDEGRAIRIANSVVAKMGHGKRSTE